MKFRTWKDKNGVWKGSIALSIVKGSSRQDVVDQLERLSIERLRTIESEFCDDCDIISNPKCNRCVGS